MDSLPELVATFGERSGANAKRMHELLRRDRITFLADAARVLAHGDGSPGCDHLLTLLSSNNLAVPLILDGALLTDEQASALAPRLFLADPGFPVRLLHSATVGDSHATPAEFCPSIRRALAVIAALGDCRRSAPLLMPLVRHADPYVRSRAALLLGAATHNCTWAEAQLQSADARIRANIIESLWGATSKQSKQLFRMAANDAHNRVAGNALLGLYRSGSVDSIALIVAMAARGDARFRATAVWVMGQTDDPRFLPCLRPMLDDAAPGVRRNAIRALAALRRAAENIQWLRVSSECATADAGNLTVRLRVVDGAGWPVAGLAATAFIAWNGEELLTSYSISADTNRAGYYLLEVPGTKGAVPRLQVYHRSASVAPSGAAH